MVATWTTSPGEDKRVFTVICLHKKKSESLATNQQLFLSLQNVTPSVIHILLHWNRLHIKCLCCRFFLNCPLCLMIGIQVSNYSLALVLSLQVTVFWGSTLKTSYYVAFLYACYQLIVFLDQTLLFYVQHVLNIVKNQVSDSRSWYKQHLYLNLLCVIHTKCRENRLAA